MRRTSLAVLALLGLAVPVQAAPTARSNASRTRVEIPAKASVVRRARRLSRPGPPIRVRRGARRVDVRSAALRQRRVRRRPGAAARARRARGSGRGLVFRTGRIQRDIDLVIFDLDGTLADTRKDIADNFKAGFEAIGVDVPYQRLLDLVDGSPLHKTYWDVRPGGSEAELGRFLAAFEAAQQRRGPTGDVYERIPALLEALSRQPGIQLAVATARPARNASELLRSLGLREHFQIVTGTHGSSVPHKPAPDVLLYVAERLGVKPDRALFIGDTHTDVLAGKRAGMATVALTYGMGDPAEVRKAGPDAITGRVGDLFDMLGVDARSGVALETARAPAPRVPRRNNVLPVEDASPPGRDSAAL